MISMHVAKSDSKQGGMLPQPMGFVPQPQYDVGQRYGMSGMTGMMPAPGYAMPGMQPIISPMLFPYGLGGMPAGMAHFQPMVVPVGAMQNASDVGSLADRMGELRFRDQFGQQHGSHTRVDVRDYNQQNRTSNRESNGYAYDELQQEPPQRNDRTRGRGHARGHGRVQGDYPQQYSQQQYHQQQQQQHMHHHHQHHVAPPPQRRNQKGFEDKIRRTVYISSIDLKVTEADLANFFSDCGRVLDCRICGDPNSAMRFAFIEFQTEDGVEQALDKSGILLGNLPLRVLPSKTAIVPVSKELMPRSQEDVERCGRTVYVANIDKKVERVDVRQFFEKLCGRICKLRLLGDHAHATRIAFIEFQDAEGAIAALNCSGALLGALPIRVSPSKTPVRPDTSSLDSHDGSGREKGHRRHHHHHHRAQVQVQVEVEEEEEEEGPAGLVVDVSSSGEHMPVLDQEDEQQQE